MEVASGNNHDHVVQLLMLAQTKSNVGDRIKNISHSILKQNSIIENIMNELLLVDKQNREIFIEVLNEIMINLIKKKLVFSDDLLNLCWKLQQVNGNEIKSKIWSVIESTSKEVIEGNSTRDWYWLNQCLLPSNVQFSIVLYCAQGSSIFMICI